MPSNSVHHWRRPPYFRIIHMHGADPQIQTESQPTGACHILGLVWSALYISILLSCQMHDRLRYHHDFRLITGGLVLP